MASCCAIKPRYQTNHHFFRGLHSLSLFITAVPCLSVMPPRSPRHGLEYEPETHKQEWKSALCAKDLAASYLDFTTVHNARLPMTASPKRYPKVHTTIFHSGVAEIQDHTGQKWGEDSQPNQPEPRCLWTAALTPWMAWEKDALQTAAPATACETIFGSAPVKAKPWRSTEHKSAGEPPCLPGYS